MGRWIISIIIVVLFALANAKKDPHNTSSLTDLPLYIEKATTYYDILNIDINATPAKIKQAYRKIALYHHPDKIKKDTLTKAQAEQQYNYFVNVTKAHEILSDQKTKTRYDYLLSRNIFEYDEKYTDWTEFHKHRGDDYTLTTTVLPDGKLKYNFKDTFALKEDQSADFALIVSGSLLFICIAFPIYLHFQGKKQREITLEEQRVEKDQQNKLQIEKIKKQMKEKAELLDKINEKKRNQRMQNKVNQTKSETTKKQSDTLFQCTICNKTYKTSNQLTQHFEGKAHLKNAKLYQNSTKQPKNSGIERGNDLTASKINPNMSDSESELDVTEMSIEDISTRLFDN